MENLLARTALDKELDAAIKRFLFLVRKITGGKLATQTMIMQAFAAQRVLAARGMRASAVFGVYADTGTLVDLSHAYLRALNASSGFLKKFVLPVNTGKVC